MIVNIVAILRTVLLTATTLPKFLQSTSLCDYFFFAHRHHWTDLVANHHCFAQLFLCRPPLFCVYACCQLPFPFNFLFDHFSDCNVQYLSSFFLKICRCVLPTLAPIKTGSFSFFMDLDIGGVAVGFFWNLKADIQTLRKRNAVANLYIAVLSHSRGFFL